MNLFSLSVTVSTDEFIHSMNQNKPIVNVAANL